jgi:hypothetical protein
VRHRNKQSWRSRLASGPGASVTPAAKSEWSDGRRLQSSWPRFANPERKISDPHPRSVDGRFKSMARGSLADRSAGAATIHPTWRIVCAASIGNALEWFDLLVYGYLAVTISRLFFPSGSEALSLLLALGTFGASYLVRPLGALVLGAYADSAGRKASLLTSIRLMMIATLLMAILPSYHSIGLLAPVCVLIIRLMPGFSVGGEFGSASTGPIERPSLRASSGPAKGWRPYSPRCSGSFSPPR